MRASLSSRRGTALSVSWGKRGRTVAKSTSWGTRGGSRLGAAVVAVLAAAIPVGTAVPAMASPSETVVVVGGGAVTQVRGLDAADVQTTDLGTVAVARLRPDQIQVQRR